jgi:AraC-like DNA-binding protein
VHSWAIERPLTGYVLLFTEDFLSGRLFDGITPRSFDFFHRVDHRPCLTLSPQDARPFHDLCGHMAHEYDGQAYGRLTVLQASLHIFLIHAQRHYLQRQVSVKRSTADHLVEDYIRLIDLHFREHKQVRDYAAMLGITVGHLTDTVRHKLGIPASQLIYRRILLEAKRLLAYSDQTIAEICFALQFDDPSYFTRFFRREGGLTPTAFRQQIREKYQHRRESAL